MDPEGDVLALFAEQWRLAGVELLVQAKHNRALGAGQPKLFEQIWAQAAQGRLEIQVQRSAARPSTGRQEAKPLREARTARAELRWRRWSWRLRCARRGRCACSWCMSGNARPGRAWSRWSGSC